MGLDAVIRNKDRRPLGEREQVIDRLTAAFPGASFAETNGRWDGTFEGNGLAIEFYLGSESTISAVEISMYGDLQRIEEHLPALGDWIIDTC